MTRMNIKPYVVSVHDTNNFSAKQRLHFNVDSNFNTVQRHTCFCAHKLSPLVTITIVNFYEKRTLQYNKTHQHNESIEKELHLIHFVGVFKQKKRIIWNESSRPIRMILIVSDSKFFVSIHMLMINMIEWLFNVHQMTNFSSQ